MPRPQVPFAAPFVAKAARLTLVNNAGIMVGGMLDASPFVEDLERCLAVNTVGAARMGEAHIPAMRRLGGRIVNLSSVLGFFGSGMLGAYAASKVRPRVLPPLSSCPSS